MKTNIGLVQINNEYSGQVYFPYSVGLLQAYAQTHCPVINEFEFVDHVYKRIPVDEAVEQLKNCAIVGFSSYVWNERLSLRIAEKLKTVNPEVLIVFGGPQVPDKSESFLRKHRFIDLAVHGEGEHIFMLILQNYKEKNWEKIPSLSYLDGEQFVFHPKTGRFKTLDEIPSPYLCGVFDGIINKSPNAVWLALWETNRGCPFSCTYCLDGNTYIITKNQIFQPNKEKIIESNCNCSSMKHRMGLEIGNLVYKGKEKCLEIHLSNGISLKATPDHRIIKVTNDKLGFVESRELKSGDWIAIQTNYNSLTKEYDIISPTINFPKTLNAELAWFIGLLIGDGCIRKNGHTVRFVAAPEIEHELRKVSKTLFGIDPKAYSTGNSTKVKHVEIHSKAVCDLLIELGVYDEGEKLKVPSPIFNSPKHVVKSFLNGLWDADGYNPNNSFPYLTTTSKRLAEEVFHLIHWIGDTARINKIDSKKYKPHVDYNVQSVYRTEWIPSENKNRDTAKGSPNLASQIPLSFGITHTLKKVKSAHNGRTRGVVFRSRLKQLYSNHELLKNEYVYVQVKHSIFLSEPSDVYDIMETENHLVIANGVVTHNCDWGSATQAKVSKFDMSRLQQEIDWFAVHKIEFIFCCDANYGILPRDIEITQFVVDSKQKTGYPKALSVQNTKNATERSYIVQKLLSDGGLNKGVTLSVQSMDKVALTNIKRENISLESYQELQRRFMKDKVETYSDMILALPGETYETFMDGMNQIIENGQHNRIQFNNLSILPNAEMGDPEYQKKFGMISIPSKIINMHGSLDEVEDETVQEMQMMVVATASMPKEDWVRVRASCWMSAFLHFDKLLQIPLVIFNKQTGITYRQIFEAFMDFDMTMDLPVLDEARRFFISEAYNLQNGGSEFVQSKKWLNLFWPADEYFFIKMTDERKLYTFYEECHEVLKRLLKKYKKTIPPYLLKDSIDLNRALIKSPHETKTDIIRINYNLMDYYQSILENEPIELYPFVSSVTIDKLQSITDWNEWLQKVVWYGNKKGGYLHGNYKIEPQLSGHH